MRNIRHNLKTKIGSAWSPVYLMLKELHPSDIFQLVHPWMVWEWFPRTECCWETPLMNARDSDERTTTVRFSPPLAQISGQCSFADRRRTEWRSKRGDGLSPTAKNSQDYTTPHFRITKKGAGKSEIITKITAGSRWRTNGEMSMVASLGTSYPAEIV